MRASLYILNLTNESGGRALDAGGGNPRIKTKEALTSRNWPYFNRLLPLCPDVF